VHESGGRREWRARGFLRVQKARLAIGRRGGSQPQRSSGGQQGEGLGKIAPRAVERKAARLVQRIEPGHPEPCLTRAVHGEIDNPAISGDVILTWLIEGCLAYHREGLKTPPAVKVRAMARAW